MKRFNSVQDRSPFLTPLLPRPHYSSFPYPSMLQHLPFMNLSRLPPLSQSPVLTSDATDHWKENAQEPLDYSMSSSASSSPSYAEADSSISFDTSSPSPPISPPPITASSSPTASLPDSPEMTSQVNNTLVKMMVKVFLF